MDLFHNPFVKTIVSAVGGAAAITIDSALQNVGGGMGSALQHNPAYAAAFTFGALFVHNVISRWQFAPAK